MMHSMVGECKDKRVGGGVGGWEWMGEGKQALGVVKEVKRKRGEDREGGERREEERRE